MKKFVALAAMALLLTLLVVPGSMAAEKPKGQKMSSNSTFTYTLTSTATKRDTVSNMWRMSGLGNYSTIKGLLSCGLYTTSISTVDTAKDTVIVEIWSGDDAGDFTPVKVWTATFVPVDSVYAEQTFDITDSTVYDYIDFQVVTNVNDATPVGSTAVYKVIQATWAKP